MHKIEIKYMPLEREMILEALPLLLEQDVRLLQKNAKKGFVAVYARDVVGILLYDVHGKFLVIDRIAVSPQYQRFGIGTGMLEMLCKLADARKYELVFSFEGESKWDPFYRFVASNGMFHIERQEGFEAVLNVEDLQALCRKHSQSPGNDRKFFDLSKGMREEFLQQVEKVYPEIAEEIRNNNDAYSRKLCCCAVGQQRIKAACFIKDYGTKMELKLLYSLPDSGMLAAKALLQSVSNMELEKQVPVYVSPMGEKAVKIIDALCPSYHIEKRIYVAYYLGKPDTRR